MRGAHRNANKAEQIAEFSIAASRIIPEQLLAGVKAVSYLRLTVALGVMLSIGGCANQVVSSDAARDERDRQMAAELAELRQEVVEMHSHLLQIGGMVASLRSSVNRQTAPAPDLAVYDVNVGDSAVLGAADAPVTIVAFMDYQCPHCPQEYEKIKGIVKESEGKVRFVMKHFPIPYHPQAMYAAAASELAKMEKGPEGFWAMSDIIFRDQKTLSVANMRQYAATLDMHLEQFDDVMASQEKMDALLADDRAEREKCKVGGTPMVLVNGLKLYDRTPEGYKKRIDEILSTPATARPGGQASADKKAGSS